jgi:hypothetical protein
MTKYRARFLALIASVASLACLASLGAASQAMAEPVFARFSDCPLSTFKEMKVPAELALCQYAETTSGEFAIGATKVPINQTLTLQGGAVPTGNPENSKEYYVLPGANGESLSKTELNVPGGLAGIIDCEEIKGEGLLEKLARTTCKAVFESKLTGVTATTEVVADTADPAVLNIVALARREGTALALPIRVHLKNTLLGSGCYIGSASNPIHLHLTTGVTSPNPPNTSIEGARGEAETLEESGQLALRLFENSLVDNAFSVPVVEGCGGVLSSILDPVIDLKLKLPSEDGNNTAILNGTLYTATAEAVEDS